MPSHNIKVHLFAIIFFIIDFVSGQQSCSELLTYSDDRRIATFPHQGSSVNIFVAAQVFLTALSGAQTRPQFRLNMIDLLELAEVKFQNNQSVTFAITSDSPNPLPNIWKVTINIDGVCHLLCTDPVTASGDSWISVYYAGYILFPKGVLAALPVAKRHCNDIDEYLKPTNTSQSFLFSTNEFLYSELNETEYKTCGQVDSEFQTPEQHISIGKNIEKGAWPWLVAILRAGDPVKRLQCEGSLISNRAVVTAAHCVSNNAKFLKPNELVLYMGIDNIVNAELPEITKYEADQIIAHPDFRLTLANFDADIAVIITKNTVQFSTILRPICIWSGPEDILDILDQTGYTGGWIQDGTSLVVGKPKFHSARIVSDRTCRQSNDNYESISTLRNFCAGNLDGNGPCTPNSGSGLMIYRNNHWQLRGISTAALFDSTDSNCTRKPYTIYTNISKFSLWLKITIDKIQK